MTPETLAIIAKGLNLDRLSLVPPRDKKAKRDKWRAGGYIWSDGELLEAILLRVAEMKKRIYLYSPNGPVDPSWQCQIWLSEEDYIGLNGDTPIKATLAAFAEFISRGSYR